MFNALGLRSQWADTPECSLHWWDSGVTPRGGDGTLLVLILSAHITDHACVVDEEMLRITSSADAGAVSGCRVLVCAVDAESATPRFDAVRINALAYIERACIVRVQVISIVTFQTKLVTVLRTIRALRMLPVLAAADAKRAYVRRR